MKRQARKAGLDTGLILISLGVVFTAMFLSDSAGEITKTYMRKLGIMTASLSAPDAGVLVMREYMCSVISEHEGDTEPTINQDPSEFTAEPEKREPEPEIPEITYDEKDIAAAESTIPPERRGVIEQIQFSSTGDGANYFHSGNGSLRNATDFATSEMQAVVDGEFGMHIDKNSTEPQVLIVHTHSTESFDRFDAGFYDSEYPTRSTDSEKNIVAVGKVLCDTLNKIGINSVHATEYHDYPSYNNSYSRSRVTVQDYLTRFPSIKIVLDIHRDGIQREDGTRVKPTFISGGQKTAQIMIVCGAGDSDSAVPNFRENLKFAARLQDSAQTLFPGFTRPALFAYRFYNHDLTTGSLVVEIGSESNTLTEQKNAAKLLAYALDGAF
ncbi:MAG: stage II sporulation protein P [Oscillospiraceae bacterium]